MKNCFIHLAFLVFIFSCSKKQESVKEKETINEEDYEEEVVEFSPLEKKWIAYTEHFLVAFKNKDLKKCTAMLTKDFKEKNPDKIKEWAGQVYENMGNWAKWECIEVVTDKEVLYGSHNNFKDPLEKIGAVMYLGQPLPKHIKPESRVSVLMFHIYPDPKTVKELQKDDAYKQYKVGDLFIVGCFLLVKKGEFHAGEYSLPLAYNV